jgi:DNA replication protein DnaC
VLEWLRIKVGKSWTVRFITVVFQYLTWQHVVSNQLATFERTLDRIKHRSEMMHRKLMHSSGYHDEAMQERLKALATFPSTVRSFYESHLLPNL